MAKNEAKIKFTAETGEFNSQIKSVGTQMSQLSAEIKLNNEQMKGASDQTEGLQKKQKLLQEQSDAMGTKIEALNGKLETAKSIFGENSTEVAKLQRELTNAETAQTRIQNAIASVNDELEKQSNASRESKTALGTLTDEISKQESELGQLKNEYTNMVLEQGSTSTESQQLATKIKALSGDLESNKTKLDAAKNATKQLDTAQEQAEQSADDMGDGYTMLKDVMADFAVQGIQALGSGLKDLATDGSTALATLKASTGATDEEMQGFESTMTDIYNDNFGENLQDIGDKMSYVKQVTGSMDSSEIQKMTESAMTLEDTFGSDFNESVRGVNNLMTHFGIDSEEAWDLFAKGSQNGLDYTDELGDNIAEYGGNFEQAGYSAEEYFQLLQNGAEGGAYNLDKVNDSINEVKNRLGDGTIEKNLDMFSGGTQTAFKEWQNGKGTMKDVIDSIVKDINGATNEQEALTMSATAFGTMGEDANLKVVKSLTSLGDDYKDVKGTMDEMANVRYDNVGDNLSQVGRNIKSAFAPIGKAVMGPINDALGWINENATIAVPIIMGLGVAFGVLAGAMAIGSIITGVQKAMALLNATMLMNPITLIVALIAGLVVALVALWNKNEAFRDAVTKIWNKIKAMFSVVWSVITDIFESAWGTIKSAWDVVQPYFSKIWEDIKLIFSTVKDTLGGFFSSAWETIKGVWNTVSPYFSLIWEGIKAVFNVVAPVIGKFFSGAVDAIKEAWSTVGPFFLFVWNAIKLIFSVVATVLGGFFKAAWAVIKTVWNVVQPFFSAIWGGIKAIFSVVAPVIGGFFSTAWNVIKAVWDVVGLYFETVWGVIKGIFSVVKNVLSGNFSGAWEAIKGIFATVGDFFRGIWDKIKAPFIAVKDWFKEKFGGAFDGIKSVFGSITTWFSDKWTAIKNVFSDPFGAFKSIGSKMWSGLKSALSSALGLKITWSQNYGKIKGAIVKVLGLQGWPSLSFAKDGAVTTSPTPLLTGEYFGARRNPEITTPENKMREAMSDVLNNNLSMNGLFGAIESIANRDINLNINGRQFATATANDSDNVNGGRMTMRNRGLAL